MQLTERTTRRLKHIVCAVVSTESQSLRCFYRSSDNRIDQIQMISFDETAQTEMKGFVIGRIQLTVCSLNQQVSAELFAIRIIGPRCARSSGVYYSFRARGSGNRFYRELLLSDSLIRSVIVARQDLRAATHRSDRHRSLIETSNDISSRKLPLHQYCHSNGEIKHAFFISPSTNTFFISLSVNLLLFSNIRRFDFVCFVILFYFLLNVLKISNRLFFIKYVYIYRFCRTIVNSRTRN